MDIQVLESTNYICNKAIDLEVITEQHYDCMSTIDFDAEEDEWVSFVFPISL
ncbi:MAG: hypothetical protein MJ203_05950 [archaeon]|nr:hypothetical protein [archaeon]